MCYFLAGTFMMILLIYIFPPILKVFNLHLHMYITCIGYHLIKGVNTIFFAHFVCFHVPLIIGDPEPET